MPLLVTVREGRGLLHDVRVRNKGPVPGPEGEGPGGLCRYEVTDYVTERVVMVTHARREGMAQLVSRAILALGR